MSWIVVIAFAIVLVAGYFWVRKNFKREIERFRQIRRSDRGE
ncbi:hypothetical protein RBS60_00925 [Sinomonas sp. ASV486]|uniref:Uncharacterized protein n=1 Tax=Sinomonas puerhi TaxID=3238584 RepID=A0AB39KZR0_9MICC|nr:hypothetical protein [Sinomonas sp. ASV486]MDQ4488753.1 hypothetical protein [Sinomonas sp. ASV486]